MSVALNAISINDFSLELSYEGQSSTEVYSSFENAVNKIRKTFKKEQDFKLYVLYHSKLSFQEYITIKSKIQHIQGLDILIDNNEFIY